MACISVSCEVVLMSAGELNKRVTIQKVSISYDSYNQPIEAWADEKYAWAKVIGTGGREFYTAQKLNAETTVVFKLRYVRKMRTDRRIKYNDRVFEIISLDDVTSPAYMIIGAKEVT